jgi:mannose/fructose/N-acetylgalactosamine-specific phosphotransferase system component IID
MAPVKPPLATAFLRLFTVQGSWNYERMLGLGVGVAEEPLLRGLQQGANGDAYHGAVARGARFFNAHPYLCGLVVGAAARCEYEGVPPEQVARLRTALCGPLGSLGDRLVWGGWLPLTSAAALIAVSLGVGWWAIAGFLVLYNIGHVGLRWWALRAGWTHGAGVVTALRHPALQRALALVVPAMALVSGFAIPLVIRALVTGWSGRDVGVLGGVAVLGFLSLRWWPGAVTGLRLGLIAVAAALAAGAIWP